MYIVDNIKVITAMVYSKKIITNDLLTKFLFLTELKCLTFRKLSSIAYKEL